MTYPAPSTAESDAATTPAESDAAPKPAKSDAAPNPAETYPAPRPAEPRPETRPGETYAPASAAGLNTSPHPATRHRARHLSRFWRRSRLQFVAALAAVIVGYAFGYVVAGNDERMQIFFSAAVGMGLFLVFSALASQLSRKRRSRLY